MWVLSAAQENKTKKTVKRQTQLRRKYKGLA
jgi:hypothetical protein